LFVLFTLTNQWSSYMLISSLYKKIPNKREVAVVTYNRRIMKEKLRLASIVFNPRLRLIKSDTDSK
jgi:hypothetical protein